MLSYFRKLLSIIFSIVLLMNATQTHSMCGRRVLSKIFGAACSTAAFLEVAGPTCNKLYSDAREKMDQSIDLVSEAYPELQPQANHLKKRFGLRPHYRLQHALSSFNPETNFNNLRSNKRLSPSGLMGIVCGIAGMPYIDTGLTPEIDGFYAYDRFLKVLYGPRLENQFNNAIATRNLKALDAAIFVTGHEAQHAKNLDCESKALIPATAIVEGSRVTLKNLILKVARAITGKPLNPNFFTRCMRYPLAITRIPVVFIIGNCLASVLGEKRADIGSAYLLGTKYTRAYTDMLLAHDQSNVERPNFIRNLLGELWYLGPVDFWYYSQERYNVLFSHPSNGVRAHYLRALAQKFETENYEPRAFYTPEQIRYCKMLEKIRQDISEGRPISVSDKVVAEMRHTSVKKHVDTSAWLKLIMYVLKHQKHKKES